MITNDNVREVLMEIINSNYCKNNEYKRLCVIKALESIDELENAYKVINELKSSSYERYCEDKYLKDKMN